MHRELEIQQPQFKFEVSCSSKHSIRMQMWATRAREGRLQLEVRPIIDVDDPSSQQRQLVPERRRLIWLAVCLIRTHARRRMHHLLHLLRGQCRLRVDRECRWRLTGHRWRRLHELEWRRQVERAREHQAGMETEWNGRTERR